MRFISNSEYILYFEYILDCDYTSEYEYISDCNYVSDSDPMSKLTKIIGPGTLIKKSINKFSHHFIFTHTSIKYLIYILIVCLFCHIIIIFIY